MGFAFAAPALTLGLAWFAWTVPPLVPSLPWVVPTLALVPVGFAVHEMGYTLSGYLADAYMLYSASAFAGLAFVRALVAGLMPLVAHELYSGLNANAAGSVLAGLSALFCVAPWVFFRWSKRLRERSPFACHSLAAHERTHMRAAECHEQLHVEPELCEDPLVHREIDGDIRKEMRRFRNDDLFEIGGARRARKRKGGGGGSRCGEQLPACE